jgi:hypothetical protein
VDGRLREVPIGLDRAPFPHPVPQVSVTNYLQPSYVTKSITHLTHFNPEDRGNMYIRNVFIPYNTTRRHYSQDLSLNGIFISGFSLHSQNLFHLIISLLQVPGVLSLGVKRPGMKLTTYLHILPDTFSWCFT